MHITYCTPPTRELGSNVRALGKFCGWLKLKNSQRDELLELRDLSAMLPLYLVKLLSIPLLAVTLCLSGIQTRFNVYRRSIRRPGKTGSQLCVRVRVHVPS